MSHRKKILLLIGLLILISGAFYFYGIYIINCNLMNNYLCNSWFFEELVSAFIAIPLFVSASLLYLIIFSERVFNVWKKFAIVAIPLMILAIFITRVDPRECGVLLCVDRTFMIFFSGIVYLILSIITISFSAIYIKLKKIHST